MGTNYYLIKPEDLERESLYGQYGIPIPRIHLGKASNGWKFLFNGEICQDFIHMMDFIEVAISGKEFGIYDEYYRNLTFEEFKEESMDRQYGKSHSTVDFMPIITDEKGFEFYNGEFN